MDRVAKPRLLPLHLSRYQATARNRCASVEELVQAGASLAERLERSCRITPAGVSWNLGGRAQDKPTIAQVGWDLYSGLLGIALFFAYFAHVYRDSRRREFARQLLDAGRNEFRASVARGVSQSLGLFIGISGWIYVLCHCGTLWTDSELLKEAESIAFAARPSISKEVNCDLSGGLAGFGAALLVLNSVFPSKNLRRLIHDCASRIVELRITPGKGFAWQSRIPGKQPFVGAAHGSSGIAWVLAESGRLLRNNLFRETARGAFEYEKSVFDPMHGGWPDFRHWRIHPDGSPVSSGEMIFCTPWCWGSTGVGIMRIRYLEATGLSDHSQDIITAINSSLKAGFGRDHSLCHGDMGHLDLFVSAQSALAMPGLTNTAKCLAALILDYVKSDRWLCGTPDYLEIPGFMAGLAGIGYEILRLSFPEIVPSVIGACPPY